MPACRIASERLLAAATIVFLAGCAATPRGPVVQAVPGLGKPFATFRADEVACEAFADTQVSGPATNQAAAGMAIGAGNGPTDQRSFQARYDAAYAQCMIARGEEVPGYGPMRRAEPAPVAAPQPEADRLVRATQTELIRLGYLGGNADGFAGARTRAAISAWQQANGLPVDGTASPRLLARLQAAPAATAAPRGWVTPATPPGGASGSPAPASAPGGWVAPVGSPAAPVSADTPAPPTSWVAPVRSP